MRIEAFTSLAMRTTYAIVQATDTDENGEMTYDEFWGTIVILHGDDSLDFAYLLVEYIRDKIGPQESTYVFLK